MSLAVFILRGLPASGKSTYASEIVRKNPNIKRINRDDIRGMLDDNTFDHNREEFVRKIRDTLITTTLRDGYSVIIDDTNLVGSTVKKLHKLVSTIGDIKVVEKCFNVSVDECLKRNAAREGRARVPDNVILGMAKSAGLQKGHTLSDKEFYYPPREQATDKYVADKNLPRCILVDLDGTVALLNGRSPYDASTCDNDLPNMPIIECVKAMKAAGNSVVFMSGREDKYKTPTVRFLTKYFDDMPYELYMRNTGDSRKDSIVKEELLEANVFHRYNIICAFDDRNQVVDHYRSLGLTVLQVAEGNF